MVKVLVTDGMDGAAIKSLEEKGYEVIQQHYEPDELGKALEDVDVLVVRSATKVREPVIDQAAAAGRLKMIIRGGVGVDNIDVDYARSKGIIVNNTPHASSAAVAELAIASAVVGMETVKCVSSIAPVDDPSFRRSDNMIRIYVPDESESPWDVEKRFRLGREVSPDGGVYVI